MNFSIISQIQQHVQQQQHVQVLLLLQQQQQQQQHLQVYQFNTNVRSITYTKSPLTPALKSPSGKCHDQSSGILHVVEDP